MTVNFSGVMSITGLALGTQSGGHGRCRRFVVFLRPLLSARHGAIWRVLPAAPRRRGARNPLGPGVSHRR